MHPTLCRSVFLCWVAVATARPFRVSFLRTDQSSTTPSIIKHVGDWTKLDCYRNYNSDVDATDRLLPFQPKWDESEAKRTVAGCVEACSAHGYCYAGLENGRECWCGNQEPPEHLCGGACDMPCSGDPSQLCGGNAALLVYSSGSYGEQSGKENHQGSLSARAGDLGPISKIVAKIKEMVESMFDRVQADISLAKKTVDMFLDHLPIKLSREVEQELSQQGVDVTGPIPKIVDKIILKKIKGLVGTMFERVQGDVASGKSTAQAFLEHLPGDPDLSSSG